MAQQNTFPPTLPEGCVVGRYRIERTLGQGDKDVSYLATESGSGAQVVLKENLPSAYAVREAGAELVKPKDAASEGAFQSWLGNFETEARALCGLDHPNVAKVFEPFRANGTAYYAISYVEGDTLAGWFAAKGKQGPSPFALRKVLRGMLAALAHLHAKGLGPWDIKPDSFRVSPQGVPALVEFGVLRCLIGGEVDLIRTSPGYAGAELADGENVGPWTDIYALGATLYHLLTGKELQDSQSRLKKDKLKPLSKCSDLVKRYGEPILADIDKALDKLYSYRWQTAEAWMEAIDALPPVEPDPEPVPEPAPEPAPQPAPVAEPAPEPEQSPQPVAKPAPQPESEPFTLISEKLEEPAPVFTPEPSAPEPPTPDKEPAGKPDKMVKIRNAALVAGGVLVVGGLCALMSLSSHDETPASDSLGGMVKPAASAQTPPSEEEMVAEDPAEEPQPAPAPEPVAETPQPTPQPAPEQQTQPEPEPTPAPAPQPEPEQATPAETPAPAAPAAEEQKDKPAKLTLVEAVKEGKVNVIKKLLDRGPSPRALSEAFGVAATQGDASIVELLLDNGANINGTYQGDYTALGFAVCYGHAEVVKLLLDRGANPNVKFEKGGTPLILAAYDGNEEIVKALLAKKASVRAKDENGDTALMIAVYYGHVAAVKLILDAAADANIKNKAGSKPMDYATKPDPSVKPEAQKEIIKFLRINGAKS